MNMRRRLLGLGAALLASTRLAASTRQAAGASHGPANRDVAPQGTSTRRGQTRRVELGLSRFTFSRAEIHAQPGDTLTLVLTSSDFVHGFSVPELNARLDVPPGSPHELTLPVLPEGRFIYLCDNFCGEGHDKMSGLLVVARGKLQG